MKRLVLAAVAVLAAVMALGLIAEPDPKVRYANDRQSMQRD